jgi:DNA topoisomerase I
VAQLTGHRDELKIGKRAQRIARLPSTAQGTDLATEATMAAKGVPRRRNLDQHGIRREGNKETGFTYRRPDGAVIEDERLLARIQTLRIPPAWQNVRIARGSTAPLQAVGVDKKGRTQYLYHARFRARREEEKFRRVVEFGEALPALRRRVRADVIRAGQHALERKRVLASMVRLMDQGFFRIGNDKSAEAESTFGLSTIRDSHVRVEGAIVRFSYVGKWRKPQQRAIHDRYVASIVQHLKSSTKHRADGELFAFVHDGRWFDVKDRHVNDYIQSIIGSDFTARDFRTWAGTLLCSIALAMQGQGPSKAERKRRLRKAIAATADQLGNTPAVCRSSYICPRLIDEYLDGKPLEMPRRTRKGHPVARLGLSLEERALLKFLRETIADRRSSPREP